MTTQTTLFTYDDYLTLPADESHYEIIDGELMYKPSPPTTHQKVLGNLLYFFSLYLQKNKIGEIFLCPLDVVLSFTDVVKPDLVYVSKERSEIITKRNVVAAPDLVVEVLSESTEAIDRSRKKELYEKYRVKKYWIVDPEERKIDQYILRDTAFKLNQTLDESQKLNSEVIRDFSVELTDLFTS